MGFSAVGIDKIAFFFLVNKCKYKSIFLHWSVITCQENDLLCVKEKHNWITAILAVLQCLCCLNHHNGKGWSVNWIFYFVCRALQCALCTKHYPVVYLLTASNTFQKPQRVQRPWNHYRILCFPLFTAISVNLKKKNLYCGLLSTIQMKILRQINSSPLAETLVLSSASKTSIKALKYLQMPASRCLANVSCLLESVCVT